MTYEANIRCRMAMIALMALLVLFAGTADVLAADGSGGWRATYDVIMRWVNFAILAFVIVKFARRPLKNFLAGKSQEIALQLKRLEQDKAQLLQKVREAQQELKDSSARFEEVRGRIVQMGERRREEIIGEAREESRILFESVQHKIEGLVMQARNTLRAEMIDAAAEKALERLPGIMTAVDNQKLLEQFMVQAAAK